MTRGVKRVKRSEGVQWSNPMCGPGRMSLRRTAEMLASGLAAGVVFCALRANLQPDLRGKLRLERVDQTRDESRDLRFSEV